MENKTFLLGVGFTSATYKEVLEYIVKTLQNRGKKYYIVTPNPEFLMLAGKDNKYKNILNGAEIALPDGIGVTWAAKTLGVSLKERITGVDLMENLCREVAKKPITVGFLGGRQDIAVKTSECLVKKYPELKVSFAASEPENLALKSHFQVDILFVAFGAPKQEIWISENLNKLNVKVAIGVGGSFDFISGKVKRAPRWVRRSGFEWLFRLIIQPWRIKRQLKLIGFVFWVLKEKLKSTTIIK